MTQRERKILLVTPLLFLFLLIIFTYLVKAGWLGGLPRIDDKLTAAERTSRFLRCSEDTPFAYCIKNTFQFGPGNGIMVFLNWLAEVALIVGTPLLSIVLLRDPSRKYFTSGLGLVLGSIYGGILVGLQLFTAVGMLYLPDLSGLAFFLPLPLLGIFIICGLYYIFRYGASEEKMNSQQNQQGTNLS